MTLAKAMAWATLRVKAAKVRKTAEEKEDKKLGCSISL
jgi:hypothetical protein